ncbi:hypothetical protein FQN60_012427 [Etheostoma spectabile]|uniref:GOST seven transmembrane domain-containing protein n=1 Tax=Etheostoma spectabile TaxID=54343 RepID=A0A5J5DPV7_9PERO|nr:hypothetical protein FQN60_012427 [Etheostoma spectabile]
MAVAHRGCVLAGYLLLLLLAGCKARIHSLTLTNETRFAVDLNTFGFFANGTLEVKLVSLRLPDQSVNYTNHPVGFSLSRSRVNGVLSYTADETETCPLTSAKMTNSEPLILFLFDFNTLSVNVKSMGNQDNILRAKPKAEAPKDLRKTREEPANDNKLNPDKKDNKSVEPKNEVPKEEKPEVVETDFQLGNKKELTLALDEVNDSYNFTFHMVFGLLAEGLYTLKFHYCQNRMPGIKYPYSFSVKVTEMNPGGYLSAAEIPLYSVFKIHWLMAALAFTKATSLVFHSINYHFINTKGHPIEGWAVMYYITHLLKGALLFITLALIGTGWAFVKYILSDKEKKIFMIVIPLQVLANVAFIIIESTEEGSSEYYLWKEILFLVDLICCGAILFPVVWSIRHLQEASSTDGKAAMNLEKLKLFRHYYVMIVCYIYFTRIIAILLKVTMPFQWQWCYEFLVEVSTLIFFVLTGYKFRPASNNPYLQLPQDEEDVEMDEVMTESGALEGISKVKKTCNGRERQKESTL